jgi:nitroreductase
MKSIIDKAAKKVWAEQIDPGKELITKMVDAAGKAPSGANAQTWKWMYRNKNLYLFFDDVFRPDLLDCRRTTMITGLGSAAENLVLKAHELGFEIAVETEQINDHTKLVSTFRFFSKPGAPVKLEPHVCDELAAVIDKRISNRNILISEPIEKSRLARLQSVAETVPGAHLIMIDDRAGIEKLAEITARMDRMRYLSKGGHNDFRGEARWTIEDAERTRTGISFLETMDLTPTEFAGFYVSKDWPVVKYLADWKLGSAFGKIQRKWIQGSSAVGLLTVPSFDTNNFFEGGRALERVWLAANADHIETHPPSLSTMIFNTLVYGEKNALPDDMREEAVKLLKEFEELFGINPQTGKVLLLRFFTGAPAEFKALRYPVKQILRFSEG